jgi:beta-galactosidase
MESTSSLAADSREQVVQSLSVNHPHLWDGQRDPYLYKLLVELYANNILKDRVEQPLGLRFFSINANQGFLLNWRPFDLHGVCRHQDRLNKGWAITKQDEREDFSLIKEMGATAIRVAHYQQSQLWYDLADRNGMVLWAEIPFVGEALDNGSFFENAKEQLRELIRQNYNHPSIMFWGVGNETRNDKIANRLIAQLTAIVREEDPTRLSTYASDHESSDLRNWQSDRIAFSKYFGWYYGGTRDLGPFLDQVHAKYPQARIGVSEYGAGASVRQHQENPAVGAPMTMVHFEEYQSAIHEHAWTTLRARPYIWCKFIWNMFDFAADQRDEGDTSGRNDKGLVTYDRKTRKDAFFFYKANWNAEPVLYITSRRFTPRSETITEVKVYSNAEAVELFVNGKSQGLQRGSDRVFQWPRVMLRVGENSIKARARFGARIMTDTCAWVLDAPRRDVTVSVTQVTRAPGLVATGSVNFGDRISGAWTFEKVSGALAHGTISLRDGMTANWTITKRGQLHLSPGSSSGFHPTEAQIEAFTEKMLRGLSLSIQGQTPNK